MAKVNELLSLRPGSTLRYRGKEYIIREVELLTGFTHTKVRAINRIGRQAFVADPKDVEIVERG